MILEIADIQITPGNEVAFEAAVSEALPLFRRSLHAHGEVGHTGGSHRALQELICICAMALAGRLIFRKYPANPACEYRIDDRLIGVLWFITKHHPHALERLGESAPPRSKFDLCALVTQLAADDLAGRRHR
jgi:hypothetical protein